VPEHDDDPSGAPPGIPEAEAVDSGEQRLEKQVSDAATSHHRRRRGTRLLAGAAGVAASVAVALALAHATGGTPTVNLPMTPQQPAASSPAAAAAAAEVSSSATSMPGAVGLATGDGTTAGGGTANAPASVAPTTPSDLAAAPTPVDTDTGGPLVPTGPAQVPSAEPSNSAPPTQKPTEPAGPTSPATQDPTTGQW
jgi:hypothetical protein